MTQFRKRPVVVDAIRWTGENRVELLAFVGKAPAHLDADGLTIVLHTLEGDMRASPGDWVIRGVADEIYPCKPEIFTASYELVEDASH